MVIKYEYKIVFNGNTHVYQSLINKGKKIALNMVATHCPVNLSYFCEIYSTTVMLKNPATHNFVDEIFI